MKVEYFEDTDTLQITFTEAPVVDTYDLDETTVIELDAAGGLVSLTLEHARNRTDLESLLCRKYPTTAA